MLDLRGREISMIFQNPRAALNPIRQVGRQIEDVLVRHAQATSQNAKVKAIELLKLVRINDPEGRYHAYPFELSGGMCQRVVIAIALACQPRLLIADEPTTGLDVTTQKTVMDLVADLTRERQMSTILITHDLGLAAQYCDRIVVMQKGDVVETATAAQIFKAPTHDYTKRLMRATPRPGIAIRDLLPEDQARAAIELPARAPGAEPILSVRELVKEYPRAGGGVLAKFGSKKDKAAPPAAFRAVDGISFDVGVGESVGLVGEFGLRQIDDLVDGDAPARSDLRRHRVRRRRHRGGADQGLRDARAALETADGVPGSDRQPQSALHGLPRHRRSALSTGRRHEHRGSPCPRRCARR